MKSCSIVTVLSAIVAAGGAQVIFNTTTDIFDCATARGNYCGGDSLETNIIIRCADFVGQPGNCNDNLAGIPPLGVKVFAPCYQTNETAGNAACSFNGIVYPDVGPSFPIPSNSTSTVTSPGMSLTYNASRTSLAPLSTPNGPKPYAFVSTTEKAGVHVDIAAIETLLEPDTKASSVTSVVLITSGAVYDHNSAAYHSSGGNASSISAFKTSMKVSTVSTSSSPAVTTQTSTTITVSLGLSASSNLPENLPFPPALGPGFRVSVNGGNSSNASIVSGGTVIGTGVPRQTESPTLPFRGAARSLETRVWAIGVGFMGMVMALI